MTLEKPADVGPRSVANKVSSFAMESTTAVDKVVCNELSELIVATTDVAISPFESASAVIVFTTEVAKLSFKAVVLLTVFTTAVDNDCEDALSVDNAATIAVGNESFNVSLPLMLLTTAVDRVSCAVVSSVIAVTIAGISTTLFSGVPDVGSRFCSCICETICWVMVVLFRTRVLRVSSKSGLFNRILADICKDI